MIFLLVKLDQNKLLEPMTKSDFLLFPEMPSAGWDGACHLSEGCVYALDRLAEKRWVSTT